jgi:hypothetical protein
MYSDKPLPYASHQPAILSKFRTSLLVPAQTHLIFGSMVFYRFKLIKSSVFLIFLNYFTNSIKSSKNVILSVSEESANSRDPSLCSG